MASFGLLAADPVRWLIGNNADVHEAVVAFLENRGDDNRDVVGPPTMEDMVRFREAPELGPLKLPVVKLRFRKCKGGVGEDGVAVECSNDELEEINRWRLQAKARTAFAASAPSRGGEHDGH